MGRRATALSIWTGEIDAMGLPEPLGLFLDPKTGNNFFLALLGAVLQGSLHWFADFAQVVREEQRFVRSNGCACCSMMLLSIGTFADTTGNRRGTDLLSGMHPMACTRCQTRPQSQAWAH